MAFTRFTHAKTHRTNPQRWCHDDVIWVDWAVGSDLSRSLVQVYKLPWFWKGHSHENPHTRCPSCSPCETATSKKDANFGLPKISEVKRLKSMTLGMARTSMAVFNFFLWLDLCGGSCICFGAFCQLCQVSPWSGSYELSKDYARAWSTIRNPFPFKGQSNSSQPALQGYLGTRSLSQGGWICTDEVQNGGRDNRGSQQRASDLESPRKQSRIGVSSEVAGWFGENPGTQWPSHFSNSWEVA